MYKAFIEPDLQTAHIKIINKFNPFTGFQNPTYILKVYIHNLFQSKSLWFVVKKCLAQTFSSLALSVFYHCSQ